MRMTIESFCSVLRLNFKYDFEYQSVIILSPSLKQAISKTLYVVIILYDEFLCY